MKVLVIEDDQDVQDLIESILILDKAFEKTEFKITMADDGLDGFKHLSDTKFDLVFVDLNLPYIKGDSIIKACREKQTINKDVNFIVISGDILKRDIDDTDPNIFLIKKPIDKNEYRMILRPLVAKSQSVG